MRFYWPIAKVDAEQRMVWGYASTEAIDDQGETVTRAALAAALDGYMRFANIREMHQNSAVGVAKEADIDEKGLYLGAKIVDDEAWRKVVEGVYNGFSIGGRVTARHPNDRNVITGLALTEISIVDRPANPEAVFDCWKFSGGGTAERDGDAPAATAGRVTASGRLERVLIELEWLWNHLAAESAQPGQTGGPRDRTRLRRMQAIAGELHGFVATLAATGSGKEREAAIRPGSAEGTSSGLSTVRDPDEASPVPAADAVAKLADNIIPRLDALQRRVDEIARTPLPPQTAGRGIAFDAISKRQDGGGATPDDIVASLARLSDEERALILIKVAHANPIGPFGSRAAGPGTRPSR